MKIFRTVILASLLLNHPSAHATSFDCNKGRSVPEQLICHRADLSKLDDELGKLYRQARRSVANPKAFRADSDSKWAWREANCADEACLRTWYSGRIEELQRLLASLPQGQPSQSPKPDQPDRPDPSDPSTAPAPAPELRELPHDAGRRVLVHAQPDAGTAGSALALQCTAAEPGITWHDQCATVLKQDTRWQYPPHSGDWFCRLATLAQTPAEPVADQ
ncbi:MAG: hypothetical protein RXR20_31165 [Paraburkholderia sp.]|jgi:uncharacterized protein YecT (DUF1311 family)|uniref:lysozyme inhibitor LprI family protein n=1 Tax=Burkholderiaceae TaxID=119060 RepID=UPI0010F4E0DA|nr:hypothetical protein [Burkholderia sp. 4M9327F10]